VSEFGDLLTNANQHNKSNPHKEMILKNGVKLFVNNEATVKKAPPGAVRFTTHCYYPVFKEGKDVCVLLEPKKMCPPPQNVSRPKYVVTFKGNALTTNPGMLRLNLLGMSNEQLGIYLLIRCSEFINKVHPSQKNHLTMCYRTGLDFDAFDFCDLTVNTVYGLAPEGRQFASYRFLENMCSGTVPVIYTSKSKLFWPFPSVYSEALWLECVRVVRQPYEILAMARDYKEGNDVDVKRRQAACNKMRTRVCDKTARDRMYQDELKLILGESANSGVFDKVTMDSHNNNSTAG
jgi:hypothetical protein